MIKKLSVAMLLVFFLTTTAGYAQEAEPQISAGAAAVVEVESGKLLYAKNAEKQMSMASTTKIMTSLLALEEGTPERVITVTEQMVKVEGTSMGLRAGDQVTLLGLVQGMLLSSGNDAANAVALAVAGSTPAFAERMNQKAKEIGMEHTHFVTPSGLDDEEHYSTAHDMAKLGAYCMKIPAFREICGQKTATVTFGNPPQRRTLTNHNKMLRIYEGANGIKTGFTKKSGRCLVSSAEKDGVTLVCVTLKDPNDWDDSKKLLDYGFEREKTMTRTLSVDAVSIPVVGGDKRLVMAGPSGTPKADADMKITHTIEHDAFLYAPVAAGDILGRVIYTDEKGKTTEVPLIAQGTVGCTTQEMEPKTQKPSLLEQIKEFLNRIFKKT